MSQRIDVSLTEQRLRLWHGVHCLLDSPVSTAQKGAGERHGSFQTPRGRHRIRALIGAGQPAGSVFVGRRPTGEIYTQALARAYPGRDWILSRILWLGGLEPGLNRYGAVDTQSRYIYIHGTPDEALLGQPVSHGCVRMSNAEVIRLFEQIEPGCPVDIHD